MKKFDLKKMIAENKATFFSSLNEGYDEFKRVEKGSKDVTAKDTGEEEIYGAGVKKGKEIEKRKMKKSELKAKIKEMIMSEYAGEEGMCYNDIAGWHPCGPGEVREADINIGSEDYDFLAELEEMLNENSPMNDPRVEQIISMLKDLDVDGETMEYILRQVGMEDQMANQLVNYPAEYAASLNEDNTVDIEKKIKSGEIDPKKVEAAAKKAMAGDNTDLALMIAGVVKMTEAKDTEKDTAETDADVTVDDTETIDTETTTEVDPNVKAVQDALTQAQAAAQKLGDKKLMDQIGNTITFFTRTHVVEKPGGAME
jgi:hypothetical protein